MPAQNAMAAIIAERGITNVIRAIKCAFLCIVLLTPLLARAAVPGAAAGLPVGTCINLGNHLDMPSRDQWGGKNLGKPDFTRIRRAGFDTVRIPVNWYRHADARAPYTIDPAWFDVVDKRVDEALAAGLNVIFNSHYFELDHADPEKGRDPLAGVWAQVARHYADRSEVRLWFEIENEPHDRLTNANLMASLGPALAEIRR